MVEPDVCSAAPSEEALYDSECNSAVYVWPLWKRPAERSSAGPLFGPLTPVSLHWMGGFVLDFPGGDCLRPVSAALPEPGPPSGGKRYIFKGSRPGHSVVPAAAHHPPG